MRNLSRNKSTIYYALYDSKSEVQDEDGLYTGDNAPSYTAPTEIRASVSAARGTSDIDLFGVNISYTKTVIVDDMSCPIDEHSILWIGISTDEPHNYEVVQVAKSLNHISYAVQEVDYS